MKIEYRFVTGEKVTAFAEGKDEEEAIEEIEKYLSGK